jgi:hypothetical protein
MDFLNGWLIMVRISEKECTIIIIIIDYTASVRWETAYSRLSVGLGSVRGRKFILTPKIKRRFLGICVLYDTDVIVLLLPHS